MGWPVTWPPPGHECIILEHYYSGDNEREHSKFQTADSQVNFWKPTLCHQGLPVRSRLLQGFKRPLLCRCSGCLRGGPVPWQGPRSLLSDCSQGEEQPSSDPGTAPSEGTHTMASGFQKEEAVPAGRGREGFWEEVEEEWGHEGRSDFTVG